MKGGIGARLAFEKASKSIVDAGFSLAKAVLSQSFLRLETALVTGKTIFNFGVLVNDNQAGSQFNTEFRLNLQDAFYASSLGLFFAVPASASASNFFLYTYPDTTAFATANTATSLMNWYNGKLSINVNNRQLLTGWDLLRHYQAQRTQTATNADYTASAIAVQNSLDGGNDSFYPVEPGLVLSGSRNNSITVELANGMAAVEANSRAILFMRGHLAQGVTSVN